MTWNFMMAGAASTGLVLLTLALVLLLTWKTAGYYGLDRWLLPLLGTPWQPGEVFLHEPRRPRISPRPRAVPPL